VRHGSRSFGALIAACGLAVAGLPGGAGAAPAAEAGAEGVAAGEHDLTVTVTGLRNGRGKVLACLASAATAFPDCKGTGAARHAIVSANKGTVTVEFGPVPPGTYAISLFHDENGNGKLDTVMMIPREGYGFSRDAAVRFGPPRFAAAAFTVGNAPEHQTLKMRYLF